MRDFFHRVVLRFALLLLLPMSVQMGAQSTAENDKPAASTARTEPRQSDAVAPTQPPKVPIHIVPYGAPATPPKAQAGAGGRSSNNGRVQYWGGPVISNVQVVQVLWGNFVDSASTAGLGQFFTDITQSNYFDLLAEFSTVGLNGFGTGTPGSNQIIGAGTFATKVIINPSVCPGASTNPACTVTDTQIQHEIAAQLGAGNLPQPVTDPASGTFNTIYMVYFPPGVTISATPTIKSCQRGGFCAYHSNVLGTTPGPPYGVFPDFSQGGCAPAAGGCGSSLNTSFQNLTSASSHELAEAVTDVDVGSATDFAPPLAWADQVSGEEIGDFCNQNTAQITVNGSTYNVQTQWSNMQNACVSAPGNFQIDSIITGAIPGTPIAISVIAQGSNNFRLLNYNDTVHFTSSDSAASLPADYTFGSGDAGLHQFTVTLNSTGMQTVTTTDTLVKGMSGQITFDIEHNPDLTIKSTHTGNFTQGHPGTYTVTVSNIGDLATNGSQVKVTDNVDIGLSITGIAGTGWTCTFTSGLGTCTTTNTIPAGGSYPPITVAVQVADNAPSGVTNFVAVSGGGDVNTLNNSFSDGTLVTQLPDLIVNKSHIGSFARGQLGEKYTLTVFNFGFGPTSSPVSVTDTLPAGLTATAIGGAGWSCSTPPTLTCTRSDVLSGSGNFYPPITLTVNVDPAAPMPNVTNTATVSGGGEIITNNDTATDVTVITSGAADLIVSSAHSGNFTQGQTGASYTLVVSNLGPVATDGTTVSVTDSLPAGLTAQSMIGTGWNCNLSNVTCTRTDALPGNTSGSISSYPPITLTVNVSPTAMASVTNIVSVSGGGDLNTANNSFSDFTTVNQLADMTLSEIHGNLAQGVTGVNYTIFVMNSGAGPTSAPVTMSDTLPAGLTATAISGQGWSCTLNPLACTRSDQLPAFSSYPVINMTVSVAINAPLSVTNVATISGGGEIITNNDQLTDPATVAPAIALTNLTVTATVKAGSAAGFTVGISAPAPGSLAVTCTGAPAGATCSTNPGTATAPFFGAISIVVTTTSALGSTQPPFGRQAPLYAFSFPIFGLTVILMMRGRRSSDKTRAAARISYVFGVCLLLFALASVGCGGGGSTTPPPPPPRVATPPGTYTLTLTVNNTTANTQASAPLTLTVQ